MAMELPKTQRAAVKQGSGESSTITVQDVPVPQPGPDQILVKINYSGLCASDKSIIYEEIPGIAMHPQTNGIAGHEGAGVVVAVGSNVQDLWQVGNRAGVKWITSVCRRCEFCTNGTDECHCPKQLNSGLTVAGTFQNYVATDAHYATRLPDGVKDEEAGPIMCGGVTSYVACKRSAVRPGQWIVILGAGGGLGHLGIQYARAMGMRVIAVDGGETKRDLCLKLGAEKYLDFSTISDMPAEITKITTYGAHAVIVFAASKASYEQAPLLVRPGATIVAIGMPSDPTVIAGAPPILMCAKRLNVVGSITGTQKEVEEALDFTARGLVHPVLTHGGLGDIERFCSDLKKGNLAGRAVIKVAA